MERLLTDKSSTNMGAVKKSKGRPPISNFMNFERLFKLPLTIRFLVQNFLIYGHLRSQKEGHIICPTPTWTVFVLFALNSRI